MFSTVMISFTKKGTPYYSIHGEGGYYIMGEMGDDKGDHFFQLQTAVWNRGLWETVVVYHPQEIGPDTKVTPVLQI